jgi:hypothetical protein
MITGRVPQYASGGTSYPRVVEDRALRKRLTRSGRRLQLQRGRVHGDGERSLEVRDVKGAGVALSPDAGTSVPPIHYICSSADGPYIDGIGTLCIRR